MELSIKGLQGKTLKAEGGMIRIDKKSFFSNREKVLPIRNITSVEVKKPGKITSGFIQFSIAGGTSRDSSFKLTGGAYDAAKDENSVVFTGEANYEIARQIQAHVLEYLERR